ncbi:MAG: sensor histidine kinase [Stackebrandtia sp.]
MVHTSVPLAQTFEGLVTRRLRNLGLAFALMGVQVAGMLAFALTIVGMPLVFLTVGIPVMLGAVLVSRYLCDAERFIFRRGFGQSVRRPYRAWPKGHLGRQLITVIKDATTWRDFAWRAVNTTLGFLVYVVYVSLFGGAVMALIQPFLYAGMPDYFGNYYGVIEYTSFGEGMLIGVPLAAVHLVVWWWGGDPMITGYAKLAAVLLRPTRSSELEQRVEKLAESRAETVDHSASELRRIERDLHDGAQARLVALGMNLGMAEEVLKSDPDSAARLLSEARETSSAALAELRDLVRGIHPPVLADRGLVGAVEALALAHPLPVTVVANLPGRPPAPVESSAYFAIAETLTNVAKYARATQVSVRVEYFANRLGVIVRDDGGGGAVVTPGGGLDGVKRRLDSFDGTVTVNSPQGGPTVVTLEIPCELSSPKTTPSSPTD